MKTPDHIQEYIDALVRQGVKARDAAPPLYRWLWRMGINIAPPFNQTFFQHFIVTGLFWGGFMAIGMTLVLFWGQVVCFMICLCFPRRFLFSHSSRCGTLPCLRDRRIDHVYNLLLIPYLP